MAQTNGRSGVGPAAGAAQDQRREPPPRSGRESCAALLLISRQRRQAEVPMLRSAVRSDPHSGQLQSVSISLRFRIDDPTRSDVPNAARSGDADTMRGPGVERD